MKNAFRRAVTSVNSKTRPPNTMKQKTGNVSHTEKEDKIIPCSVLSSSLLSLGEIRLTSAGGVARDMPSAKDVPAGLATEKKQETEELV